MNRSLAKTLSDLCLDNDIKDMRIETQIGAHEVKVCEIWIADGVLHISVTGEIPRVTLH